MKKKSKIGSIAASVILVFAVVLCIFVIAQTLTKGYVTLCKTSLFRVVTGSMEPTIPTGALLVSKEVDIKELEVGDIICFTSMESYMKGQVVTHRINAIRTGNDGEIYLETRGDANTISDGYSVTKNNLIGKVIYHTKKGNWLASIFSIFSSKIGFLACIVFPVLLIAGFIMKDSVSSIRKELDALSATVEKMQEPGPKATDLLAQMSPEEYAELVARLKQEILEEVKQSVEETGADS